MRPVAQRDGRVRTDPDLPELVRRTASGDQEAFAALYDAVAAPVYGLVLRVLCDPAQSEEVAQEVMIETWRTAARYRADRGAVLTWVLTLAHRRAVDRVRSEQAAADRERRTAAREGLRPYDEVVEQVETRLEARQVRRCLRSLTELQLQAVTLAYYGGFTHREVAASLATPLGTVKTRLRDGLIRLRDCMGVTA